MRIHTPDSVMSILSIIRDRLTLILSFSALAAGLLGLTGYLSAGESFLDAVYNTLGLFLLNYSQPGPPSEPVDPDTALNIARFLAPATTVTAAIAAVLLTLVRNADRLLARRVRNHTIICNPRDHGITLAANLRDSGEPVIVVASPADKDLVEELRHNRIPVIEGNPAEEFTLVEAGARRARRVIGLPDDEGTNFRIASALTRIPVESERREVNLFSGDLSQVDFLTSHSLQIEAITGAMEPGSGQRQIIEWGSLDRITAILILAEYMNLVAFRAMLQEEADEAEWQRLQDEAYAERLRLGLPLPCPRVEAPPADSVFVGADDLPTIVVTGRSPAADALVFELARRWWSFFRLENPAEGFTTHGEMMKLPVVLFDSGDGYWADHLHATYPGITESLLIRESTHIGSVVSGASGSGPPVVFVFGETPAHTLHVLAELDALPPTEVNVVLCGDASVLESLSEAGFLFSRGGLEVSTFDAGRQLFSIDLISNTLLEQLAILHHSIYERNVFGLPASEPWTNLDEGTRDSDRQAVIHHIATKLPSQGLTITPIGNQFTEEPLFEFSQRQIEELAEKEHERWMEERFAAGWIFNPALGDGQDKTKSPWEHGNLRPWNELSEAAKNKDRMFIIGLPAILRSAGFRIVPQGGPKTTPDSES